MFVICFQNSLETILSSTECNLHEYVDDTSQMLAINNFNPEFHKHETNGKKIHTFFNNFSTSCVDISKGYILYKKISFLNTFCMNKYVLHFASNFVIFFNDKKLNIVFVSDNAEKILVLESKCEQLRAQIEKLNKEKKIAFEEIERLKDQVKSDYFISVY